jgi:hypothetical protein
MKAFYALLICCSLSLQARAQATSPEIYSWHLNTTGATGYNGITADVQRVQYSENYVYVSCSDIPSYTIGPWPGNPNTPQNQGHTFKIPRHPQKNSGTQTATALGHIGVWSNGVSIFNSKDAMSYQNRNIWHQNAVVVEAPSFDACLGHPAPNSEYHHHQNPICLYQADITKHSPIIGYAFDGYPIYGAYGYATIDGTGGIRRMRSSYQLRTISQRTTLPDGSALQTAQYGPDVSTTYPLGYYIEDFEYAAGTGDLDEHNGRYCVTPEYPQGTYAYFVTIDAEGHSAYPYVIGETYYGVVQAGNVGPGSGHVTVDETVTDYTGAAGVDDNAMDAGIQVTMLPHERSIIVRAVGGMSEELSATVVNMVGVEVRTATNGRNQLRVDVTSLPKGFYLIRVTTLLGTFVRTVQIVE